MKRFRKVYVEITNVCNMKCSFCPETKRAKAFMRVEDFEKVASEIVHFTDYIYLHVKGEPLLHPNLKEILDICNKYNLKINISTNGVLLKDKINILKNAKIRQLNVSLHSFENESKDKLKEYIQNVLNVCNTLADQETIIRYKLWNADNDVDGNNKYILDMLKKMYNVDIKEEVYIKDKKLAENIFLSIKTPFKWPDINNDVEKHNTCYGLRRQVAVLVDGTVTPCCVDNNGDINLGNVLDNPLEQILNSKKALAIKKGFEDNKCVEKLCKKCEYKETV